MNSAAANSDGLPSMHGESKLAKAEASRYIEQQKSANLYTKIADYMFWGATSLILPVLGVGLGFIGAPALLGVTGTLAIGGIASVATFAGSLLFSRKATELSEKSNVLYSDIDSQNQARRMVQGFARAQAQDVSASADDIPFTAGRGGSWQERVGGSRAQGAVRWQDRIAAEADREDAIALNQLSR